MVISDNSADYNATYYKVAAPKTLKMAPVQWATCQLVWRSTL